MNNKLKTSLLLLFSIIAMSCQKNEEEDKLIATAVSPVTKKNNTYYLSPWGTNTNSGLSQTSPFKTFEKSIAFAKPGDTVYFKDGTYTIYKTISIATSELPDNYNYLCCITRRKSKISGCR